MQKLGLDWGHNERYGNLKLTFLKKITPAITANKEKLGNNRKQFYLKWTDKNKLI